VARKAVEEPDLPSDLETVQPCELVTGTTLEAVRVEELTAASAVYDATVKESVLAGVDLSGRRLGGFRAVDVRFESCDLAGTVLEGASLTRVSFVRCRMTGTVLSGAQLQDVQLLDCSANMLALRMAQASRVLLTGSSLREADLYEAVLESTRIEHCDLSSADVSGVTAPGLDLRGSTLDALVGLSSLRGAVISTEQLFGIAHALAGELGLVVSDD
jgi:uncharacterized protein YjbI with pentapeptide repeats